MLFACLIYYRVAVRLFYVSRNYRIKIFKAISLFLLRLLFDAYYDLAEEYKRRSLRLIWVVTTSVSNHSAR